MERPCSSNAEVNEKCVSRKLWMEEKEDLSSCQIPWPAKPYSCSFCRREFRSAQALGGHMNIHRRDRARLRLLPSWISQKPYTYPNPNPNPNPNFSSPSSSASLLNFSSKNHSHASSSSASPFSFSGRLEGDPAKRKSFIGGAKGLAGETEKIISLDLKKETLKNPSGYLDLELRLGYL